MCATIVEDASHLAGSAEPRPAEVELRLRLESHRLLQFSLQSLHWNLSPVTRAERIEKRRIVNEALLR